MLGTNDVNIGKRDANTILDAYTSILGSLRAANPKVSVIVSFVVEFPMKSIRISNRSFRRDKIDKLIPTSWSDKTIEAVNTAIPGLGRAA